ncbi:AUGMIN subunit 8 [Nymphaea thermarum]|nr:AUGMIN subunit 8 [Nymphaea thermarum]
MEEALESRQAEVRTQNDDAEPCEKKKGAAHRRPRVRVVSSRFMSPVAPASSSSSSSTSLDCPGSMKCPIPRRAPPPSSCSSSSSSSSLGINLRGSQSALRRRAGNSCPSTDDDEGDDTDDDCASLDSTPIKPEGERSVISRPLRPAINQQFNFHPSPFASGLQQGKRRGAKQSKEIVELTENVDPLDGNGKVMNTMILKRSTVGRTPKTTFMSNNLLRPNPHGGVVSSASSTAAARLVQSNGLVPGKNDAIGCGLNAETVRGQPNANCTRSSDPISSQAIICDSPPLPVHGSNAGKGRAMHGCRSSMPESDLFPTMSRKTIVEMSRSSSGDPFGDQYHKSVAPLCSRSLNSTLLSCQQSIFADPSKSVCKSVTASKCYPSPTKTSSTYLPPHPSNAKNVASVMKPAVEPMKRGKKLYGHQEDAHLLRLLYNRHLQWRFTNAKAEAAMHAQTTSAERSLHCLWAKISEMQQSVSSKRAEIERLKASRRIRCILDGQMLLNNMFGYLRGLLLNVSVRV